MGVEGWRSGRLKRTGCVPAIVGALDTPVGSSFLPQQRQSFSMLTAVASMRTVLWSIALLPTTACLIPSAINTQVILVLYWIGNLNTIVLY